MELLGRRFGHIRLSDVIGQGGMGDVYSGHDEKLDRKVALKVLHAENRLDAQSRERLLREARALSKLEHPNICRIYDYIESSDVDVLVLEYLDGRTLQEVIEAGQVTRAEKLRIAIDVAAVLVAAHRVGIIHRDLKPENVMITKDGQVKVLDFGLARWINAGSSGRLRAVNASESESVSVAMDSESLWFPVGDSSLTAANASVEATKPGAKFFRTEAGIAMGTPLYMSPEQARGETLTSASDMFSFGLLLQFLFTGADPHPMGLSAREVMLRAARGETTALGRIPGDVAGLINRLKQFAPADRPTGVEVVAALRHLAEKPRRIVRRAVVAIAVLVVLLGVWRYTVDLSHARAEAEARRAQAEDLINFMVGDLRGKLEAVQRLDILDDVAEKALQYVGSSNKETATPQELIAHAKALNQLGEVRIGQGNLAGAMSLFKESLDRASAAVQRAPHNDDAKYVLALSHFWMGNGYRLQDDPSHALEHARAYLALTSDLAARHPTDDKYVLESAYAHSQQGMILEGQGDLRGAIAEYRTTLAIKETHGARHPSDDAAKEDVARTINKLAFAVQKSGDLQTARRYFESEVTLREQLMARNPTQVRWKADLAVSHGFLASLLDNLGQDDAALEHRHADVRLHTELANYDPANRQYQRNLAIARGHLGRMLAARGDFDAAYAEFRSAEEACRVLATDRTRPTRRGDAAGVQSKYAWALLAGGHRAAALQKIDEAIAICGTDEVNRGARGGALLVRGSILAATGAGQAAARESWLSAAELLRPADPQTLNVRELENWARVLIALGRREEAGAVVARLRGLGFRSRDFESLRIAERY